MKTTIHFGQVQRHVACLVILSGALGIAFNSWAAEEKKGKEIQVFIEEQVLVALENGEEVVVARRLREFFAQEASRGGQDA